MIVRRFDPTRGVYHFEVEKLSTTTHAHPAFEVLIALSGWFTVSTADRPGTKVNVALIPANVRHRVTVSAGAVTLIMVEGRDKLLGEQLTDIPLVKGGIRAAYLPSFTERLLFKDSVLNLCDGSAMDPMEARVHKCIGYLQTENFDRRALMDRLTAEVHLSPSRLSHLFRAEMGISLKKYLVWSRLKRTLQFVLKERQNLYAASLRAGFYDQAHLSRAFKNMLGLPPSAVYNSRTVQDS